MKVRVAQGRNAGNFDLGVVVEQSNNHIVTIDQWKPIESPIDLEPVNQLFSHGVHGALQRQGPC